MLSALQTQRTQHCGFDLDTANPKPRQVIEHSIVTPPTSRHTHLSDFNRSKQQNSSTQQCPHHRPSKSLSLPPHLRPTLQTSPSPPLLPRQPASPSLHLRPLSSQYQLHVVPSQQSHPPPRLPLPAPSHPLTFLFPYPALLSTAARMRTVIRHRRLNRTMSRPPTLRSLEINTPDHSHNHNQNHNHNHSNRKMTLSFSRPLGCTLTSWPPRLIIVWVISAAPCF